MSDTPLIEAVARALRFGIVEGPPAGDPNRLYVQFAMLRGEVVRKLWSRQCDVDVEFTHMGKATRLAAAGIGVWFEPVCNADALLFCALSLSEAIQGEDFPRYPRTIKPVCLGHLAAWVSENTQPGGGESWRWWV